MDSPKCIHRLWCALRFLKGAGQLPKFFDNIYRDAEEDFMWLGTAEIALTNMHRDEILQRGRAAA